jgi:hypothetical protein
VLPPRRLQYIFPVADLTRIQHDNTFEVGPHPSGRVQAFAGVARQAAGTSTRNVLNLFSPAVLLEVHDNFFHHNSAVMMPDCDPEDPGPLVMPVINEDREYMDLLNRSRQEHVQRFRAPTPGSVENPDERVSGLGVLVVAYRFQKLNPNFRLLLAGHADTSGDAGYNFTLSELRARNVLHLLLGERSPWVEISLKHSQVDDQQRILKHYARTFRWPCDPGEIDNQPGPRTEQAVLNFQSTYNRLLRHSIQEDGIAGKETWGAFFDLYMEELAQMMQTRPDGLEAKREVNFLDPQNRFIACGEQNPIDHPERQNFRSKENRRVEFLFFHKSFPPDLTCHRSTAPSCMRSCTKAECGVYGPDRFQFVHLRPKPMEGRLVGDFAEEFQVVPTNEDLSQVAEPPDQRFNGSMAATAVGTADPWAFLEPFSALEPKERSDEVAQDPTKKKGA